MNKLPFLVSLILFLPRNLILLNNVTESGGLEKKEHIRIYKTKYFYEWFHWQSV